MPREPLPSNAIEPLMPAEIGAVIGAYLGFCAKALAAGFCGGSGLIAAARLFL